MERWVAIPEYERLYSVSELGRVRIEVRRQNIRKGAMLTQSPFKDGYLYVALRRENETRPRNHAVARLVLTAFVAPPEPKQEANHKNGDITDNRLENLEWCTKLENIHHSMTELGHTRKGEKNPASRLTERQVIQLRKRAAKGETYAALGRRFGISTPMACMIARGRAWKETGGPIAGDRPKGRPSSQ